jgi:hypothetical protein
MSMGETGMSEMSDMAEMMDMPLPENTLPMMTGTGQYGAIEMGGMFTTLKVRENLARNDYKDPGAYKHPKSTVASEYSGADKPSPVSAPPKDVSSPAVELKVRKPATHDDHSGH